MHRQIGLQAVNDELGFMGRSKSDAAWTRIRIHEAGIAGPGVTIFLNRNILVKALRFGLSNIDIIDVISPLRFSLGGRQMIVMPLRA
ncbi:MAG: polymerase subunit beta [Verrucomicrobiaceae bacterium]|nr:polymerase subunit beta [Verrucomicrobiaceae bacterium]